MFCWLFVVLEGYLLAGIYDGLWDFFAISLELLEKCIERLR